MVKQVSKTSSKAQGVAKAVKAVAKVVKKLANSVEKKSLVKKTAPAKPAITKPVVGKVSAIKVDAKAKKPVKAAKTVESAKSSKPASTVIKKAVVPIKSGAAKKAIQVKAVVSSKSATANSTKVRAPQNAKSLNTATPKLKERADLAKKQVKSVKKAGVATLSPSKPASPQSARAKSVPVSKQAAAKVSKSNARVESVQKITAVSGKTAKTSAKVSAPSLENNRKIPPAIVSVDKAVESSSAVVQTAAVIQSRPPASHVSVKPTLKGSKFVTSDITDEAVISSPAKSALKSGKAEKTAKVSAKSKADAPADFMPYQAASDEEYMNAEQLKHFRALLNKWKQELMEEVDRTVHHMQDESANLPDPADRATQEEEFTFELRTRDRERKLIKKIDQALEAIDAKEYGFCESCGVEIGVRRLEARPTATLCIDCKTLDEIKEKQLRGA